MQAIKGYRTIIFNAIMLAIMFARQQGWLGEADAPTEESVNAFLDNLDGVLTFVWGIGNIALRFVTNTPPGKSA